MHGEGKAVIGYVEMGRVEDISAVGSNEEGGNDSNGGIDIGVDGAEDLFGAMGDFSREGTLPTEGRGEVFGVSHLISLGGRLNGFGDG